MGACCCCASKGVELNPAPYHNPVTANLQPLSSPLRGTSSPAAAPSAGLLVNPNLDTSSIVNTYTPPPNPLPFDYNLRRSRTPSRGEITNASNNADDADKGPKEADCKVKSENELASSDAVEFEETDDLKKATIPFVPEDEEDGCPICLEDYDEDNPKLLTQCEHHFHLACILEWMERSEACPVCDKEVVIDPSLAS